MNLHDMDCFLKICERKSISSVAKDAFVSPQALSKSVMRMERELGAKLLLRSQKGVEPTACGRVFCRHAERMLKEYRTAAREIASLQLQSHGFLRLVSAFGILRFLTPEFIHAFGHCRPKVHLDYMEFPDAYVEANLLRGQYDVGLLPYTVKVPTLSYQPLFSCEIFFIAHPGSRFYDRESISVREIAAEPLVIENQNFLIHHIFWELCRQEHVTPDVYFNTSGFSLCYKLCRERVANTVSMDFIFRDMQDETLRMIPFEEHPMWPVALVGRKGVPRSGNVQAFLEHAQSWCQHLRMDA